MTKQDLSIRFSDNERVIEISMTEGDRIVLQTDHLLSAVTCEKIHKILKNWLSGKQPVLILDQGIKLAVIRVCQNKM
jgi:hypothetical protein